MIKKLFEILPLGQKKKTIVFFVLLIISMILEALSIGLIFPVIMIFLSDENTLQEYIFFDNFLKNYSDNQILIWLVFTIVFLYFLRIYFYFFTSMETLFCK